MNTIYLVAGSPGVGKTWVCDQLKDKYNYIRHDDYINDFDRYLREIKNSAKHGHKKVLTEIPFSISKVQEPLEKDGFKIINVYIAEDPKVLTHRYEKDRGTEIPKGHLTRQNTYIERAKASGSFIGKPEEVLNHLRAL